MGDSLGADYHTWGWSPHFAYEVNVHLELAKVALWPSQDESLQLSKNRGLRPLGAQELL